MAKVGKKEREGNSNIEYKRRKKEDGSKSKSKTQFIASGILFTYIVAHTYTHAHTYIRTYIHTCDRLLSIYKW